MIWRWYMHLSIYLCTVLVCACTVQCILHAYMYIRLCVYMPSMTVTDWLIDWHSKLFAATFPWLIWFELIWFGYLLFIFYDLWESCLSIYHVTAIHWLSQCALHPRYPFFSFMFPSIFQVLILSSSSSSSLFFFWNLMYRKKDKKKERKKQKQKGKKQMYSIYNKHIAGGRYSAPLFDSFIHALHYICWLWVYKHTRLKKNLKEKFGNADFCFVRQYPLLITFWGIDISTLFVTRGQLCYLCMKFWIFFLFKDRLKWEPKEKKRKKIIQVSKASNWLVLFSATPNCLLPMNQAIDWLRHLTTLFSLQSNQITLCWMTTIDHSIIRNSNI